ncbi:hypothetical protein M1439_02800 [Candidatus Marsarchaeota archaeon]|jgi:hypothetical protein|nr:hypothetical protein [Candidatus Marsarchaeota archaeon]MCL5092643.1 hypothetical protein [Candidatus Marsarchaeota archaeon]
MARAKTGECGRYAYMPIIILAMLILLAVVIMYAFIYIGQAHSQLGAALNSTRIIYRTYGNASISASMFIGASFYYNLSLSINGNGTHSVFGISNPQIPYNALTHNATLPAFLSQERTFVFTGLKPYSAYSISLHGTMGPICYPGKICAYATPDFILLVNKTIIVDTGANGTTTNAVLYG